jgi:hypothetical protein
MNWDRFVWSSVWPNQIMDKNGVYPRACEFETMAAEAMKVRDNIYGVKYGAMYIPMHGKVWHMVECCSEIPPSPVCHRPTILEVTLSSSICSGMQRGKVSRK